MSGLSMTVTAPICNAAAQALQIRQRFGALYTLDARSAVERPRCCRKFAAAGFDLDQSMVIYHQGQFYHGPSALKFMAPARRRPRGAFNLFNKGAVLVGYACRRPVPLDARRPVTRCCGGGVSAELTTSAARTARFFFGYLRRRLGKPCRRYFTNITPTRPYSDDIVTVDGRSRHPRRRPDTTAQPGAGPDGRHSPVHDARRSGDSPVLRVTATHPLFTSTGSSAFRAASLTGFHSRLLPRGGNEMVEIMPFGLGWRAAYTWGERQGRPAPQRVYPALLQPRYPRCPLEPPVRSRACGRNCGR